MRLFKFFCFDSDNVGETIKTLAKVVCSSGIAVFWATSLIYLIIGIFVGSLQYIESAFLCAVVWPFVVWVGNLILYAFGELVNNSILLASPLKAEREKARKAAAARAQQRIAEKQKQKNEAAERAIANPETDEDEYIDVTCPHCNEVLSYTKGQLQSPKGVICPLCDTSFKI